MQTEAQELRPHKDDLLVVPEDMKIGDNLGFEVHRMKYLHAPSIVRKAGFPMSVIDRIRSSTLASWLGLDSAVPEAKTSDPLSANQVELGPKVVFHDVEFVVGRAPSTQAPTATSPASEPASESMEAPTFFRYVRMYERLDTLSGGRKVLLPKGGVAFYVELDVANDCFVFSFAICSRKDNFSYKVARSITKQRFASEDWYEVTNYDSKMSIVDNIHRAVDGFLYSIPNRSASDPAFSSVSERATGYEMLRLKEMLDNGSTSFSGVW